MKNNIRIDKLIPREKRYSISLGNGLTIRVMPSGIISWIVRIPFKNQIKDITISHYPEINKKQAIAKARQLRKKYNLVPPKGYTFRDAFSLWCQIKKNNIISYKNEKQRIIKYLINPFGSYQLDELTPPIVIEQIKKLYTLNKKSTLKRCLMRLKEIYNLAVCAGYVSNNSMIGINKLFKPAKVKPRKSINYKELSSLLIKIEPFPIKVKLVFLLSLFTLLRPGEVVKLKWSWIRNDVLVIPSKEMKNRKEFRIPLNPIIIKLLEIIKKNNKHKRSSYLFTGTKSNKHLCSQYLTNYLRSRKEFRGYLVPHGIRSIGRTWMADNKVSFEVAEACLSHTTGNSVSRAYQRSDYLEPRKEVLLKWNKYILSCASSSQELMNLLKESID